ncbi:MAG: DUF5063 domain-containing protein [Duncaniella sp.]|nr:DUF5063 domain-containing protein [Duncaniella sp.]MDE6465324.1 DUF5063 domain-containing protein [Duncaniella sp.]
MGLKPNTLAFIGLCNEYCQLLESASDTEAATFVSEALRLLPRIYISATDLDVVAVEEDYPEVDCYLEEEYYESVRRNVENLLGPDDVYLEVFEKEMKYSDTPIGASVSEGLCDLFQVFYNLISTIRYADESTIEAVLVGVKEDFTSYWSQILVNILRPLNNIRYNVLEEDDE